MSEAAPSTAPRPVMALDRTKALSDGVVAIVITLIVLSIEVPTGQRFDGPGLREFLGKVAHDLHPYFGSFALIAAYWVQHAALFHYVKLGNRTFVWLNLLFLLPMTLIPIANEARTQYPSETVILALFATVHLGCQGGLILLWSYATKGRRLVSPRVPPEVVRSMGRRMLAACGLIVAASLVSILNGYLATAVLALVPILNFSHREVDSHWSAE